MQKFLIICGPTATGKTSLGIYIAKKFNGEIISADSRQVYKGMDIGTGKEWGEDVKIWGYDLVGPKEEFSVSKYLKFAEKTITDILHREKLPVLVGGTGFYIKGVVDGIPTIDVPRNNKLRKNLDGLSAERLYENLSQIDSLRAGAMNSSDRKNPRRLVRAIEIAQYLIDHRLPMNRFIGSNKRDILFVGLTAPEEFLNKRIEKRVEKRIEDGFDGEVKKLIGSGVAWEDQSMMSLGYRQWRDYIEGAVDKEVATEEWKKEERKYAKRQMVWWKKDPRINWFDISDPGYRKKVENMIEKWHNGTHVQKNRGLS